MNDMMVLILLSVLAVVEGAVKDQKAKTSNVNFSLFVGLGVTLTAAAVYLGRKIKKTIVDDKVDVENQSVQESIQEPNKQQEYHTVETTVPKPKGEVGKIVENLEKDIRSINMISRQESFDPRRAASPKRF